MDENLSRQWIEHHATGNHDLFWAWEELESMVLRAPECAWLQILDIATATDDQKILSNLAAGPLEDLLGFHGPAFIDRIEVSARRNPKFARLVAGVWRNSMSDSLWQRVHGMQIKYS